MARITKRKATYRAWRNMLARCYNPNHVSYKDYGGRGIRVWEYWNPEIVGPLAGFKNFIKYVGLRPTPEHSLDRKDPDGHYEPINVRWSTMAEQGVNKRTTIIVEHPNKPGVRLPAATIARELNMSYQQFRYMLEMKGKWPTKETQP